MRPRGTELGSAESGYVAPVRVVLPHHRDQLDPLELPPPELIALLFFLSAVGLLLLRGG